MVDIGYESPPPSEPRGEQSRSPEISFPLESPHEKFTSEDQLGKLPEEAQSFIRGWQSYENLYATQKPDATKEEQRAYAFNQYDQDVIKKAKNAIAGGKDIDENLKKELLKVIDNIDKEKGRLDDESRKKINEALAKQNAKGRDFVDRFKEALRSTEKDIEEYLEKRARDDEGKPTGRGDDEHAQFARECIREQDPQKLAELLEKAKDAHADLQNKPGTKQNAIDIGLYQKLIMYLTDKQIDPEKLQGVGSSDRANVFTRPEDQEEFAKMGSTEYLVKLAQSDFGEFKRRLMRLYNAVLSKADLKPDELFERAIDPMYERPYLNQILGAVKQTQELIAIDEIQNPETYKDQKDENLSVLLAQFGKQLDTEQRVRSFSHNIAVLTAKRAGLQDIAGYAEQMQSADLDAVFYNDPLVVEAAQLFEQKMTQALSNNNWRVDLKLLQSSLRNDEGKEADIDREIIDMLVRKYRHDIENNLINLWEITRAYRLAKGTMIGALATWADLLGEADPPVSGRHERGSFGSYAGEKILGIWNTRHHFLRFEQPNELHDLMYAMIEKKGSLKGWSHKKLEEMKQKFQAAHGTDRFKLLDELGGKPFVEIMNFFKVGGVLTRGGWRTTLATYHLLDEIAPEDRNKNSYLQGLPSLNVPTGVETDLRATDWKKSWENLRRGGTSMLWHWAEERAKNEVRAENELSNGSIPEEYEAEVEKRKNAYRADALAHKLRVDPLWFSLREKEDMYIPDMFQRSIRGKALRAVCASMRIASPNSLSDIENLDADTRKKVYQAEEDLMNVHKYALREAWRRFDVQKKGGIPDPASVWKKNQAFLVDDSDFTEAIEKDEDRKRAKAYFDSLKESLAGEKGKEKITWFKERGFDYSLGTEDVDYNQYRFNEAGPSIVGRAWGDAANCGEAFELLQALPDHLTEANNAGVAGEGKKALEELAAYIGKIVTPIEIMHGPPLASERARELATVIDRYFKKDWTARILPEPFQGILENFGLKVSRAREAHGRDAWNWTENETHELLEILERNRVLDRKDKILAMKTLGARNRQIWAIDVPRSLAFVVFMFILLQAVNEASQMEQS